MAKKRTENQSENSEARARQLANLKPWPKGVSGNPKGRPKTRTLSEAYRAALAQPIPGDPDGKTYADRIAEMVVSAAAKGDVPAARELADRTEGKPRQMLDVDMTMMDWRELATRNGLNPNDVLDEARRLIESAATCGGEEPAGESTQD